MTIQQLENAAMLADELAAAVDTICEEAKSTNKPTLRGVDVIKIRHGAWNIDERNFWREVAKRFREIQLAPA